MNNPTINLDSIDAYNKLYGLKTSHPLVSVIDLKTATRSVNHISMEYGVYALFLKNGAKCSIKYGRRKYDYQEGTVVSFSPGQVIDVDMEENEFAPDVIGLMFHPDLIYGTPLAEKISEFRFFDYSEMESLHLSENERSKFLYCLDMINQELNHPVDNHSAALLSANIQVLLEYMDRFYDRQFITRHKVNSDIVAQFHRELKMYYKEGAVPASPTVAYFADKANLSQGYFSDLVRKETGLTPKEIITRHIVAHAKHLLVKSSDDISQIAYNLGFDYPAHFTRIFKRVTGKNPTQFRAEMADKASVLE
ncbi:MAG: helix-turn-helix domain-containing protein [Candidatus Amulumruptor caecigallinarius]|nr:helix-turn-helix domain-containing protein [Candidatus Amulumruptor caecigallinarius]